MIKFKGRDKETGNIIEGCSIYQDDDKILILENGGYVFTEECLPDYNAQAIGCGIEDNNITDRYEACEYGFFEAIDRVKEQIPDWREIQPWSFEMIVN